jgi:hypothetical protein
MWHDMRDLRLKKAIQLGSLLCKVQGRNSQQELYLEILQQMLQGYKCKDGFSMVPCEQLFCSCNTKELVISGNISILEGV